VLELGAELISSDAIAIYELVKNAFDADSEDVDVSFNTVIDAALARVGLSRPDIYVTQTFHLIPRTRSERISQAGHQTLLR
jgi:hypothetical protein